MVATSGSLIFGLFVIIKEGPVYAWIIIPVIIAIWSKHLINFRRIKYGVEAKLSYIWNKKEEKERIQNNWNKLSEEEKIYVGFPELSLS